MPSFKSIIAFFISAALAAANFFVGAVPVSAATTSAATSTAASASAATSTVAVSASDSCAIKESDLAVIQAIQSNPALTYTQEIKQELAARQALLTTTLNCAQGEAKTLQTQLNAVTVSDPEAQSIQQQLSSDLDDAINYYAIEINSAGSAGIDGTEEIARASLAWRQSNYVPLAGNVDNFILWSQNQSLFATAATRMTQISQLVSFLGATTNTGLDSAFMSAQASYLSAQKDNTAAEHALAQSLPSSDSLSLIQESLQSLAATYQDFFTVSGIVQGITPGSD